MDLVRAMRLGVVLGVAAVMSTITVEAAGRVRRPFDAQWTRLADRLVADGFDRYRVRAIFGDPRIAPFTGLAFSLYPREHSAMYRRFRRGDSVAGARRCRAAYDAEFGAAERRFGVPASVTAAILHVETHCGRNTGRRVVLEQLAALAAANDPDNVRWNLARHTAGVRAAHRPAVEARVRERARYLENTFYPEVVALLQLADRQGIDPFAVRGSSAGAFGLPQFLPSSYLRFAVDGDGDGRISLYDPADAIASAANYLRGNGWSEGLSSAERRRVVWSYNHSDAYIDAVLWLADRIEVSHPSSPRGPSRPPGMNR
jgi:membrane-bound lytic murein transglycosylase B